MGRENMSDYNADFLTMLQTWDAAVGYMPSKDGKPYQPIDIANFLWWTQDRSYRDAAVGFWPSKDGQAYQPIDIANLLGWTPKRTLGA
jgi:hypothetical protein